MKDIRNEEIRNRRIEEQKERMRERLKNCKDGRNEELRNRKTDGEKD